MSAVTPDPEKTVAGAGDDDPEEDDPEEDDPEDDPTTTTTTTPGTAVTIKTKQTVTRDPSQWPSHASEGRGKGMPESWVERQSMASAFYQFKAVSDNYWVHGTGIRRYMLMHYCFTSLQAVCLLTLLIFILMRVSETTLDAWAIVRWTIPQFYWVFTFTSLIFMFHNMLIECRLWFRVTQIFGLVFMFVFLLILIFQDLVFGPTKLVNPDLSGTPDQIFNMYIIFFSAIILFGIMGTWVGSSIYKKVADYIGDMTGIPPALMDAYFGGFQRIGGATNYATPGHRDVPPQAVSVCQQMKLIGDQALQLVDTDNNNNTRNHGPESTIEAAFNQISADAAEYAKRQRLASTKSTATKKTAPKKKLRTIPSAGDRDPRASYRSGGNNSLILSVCRYSLLKGINDVQQTDPGLVSSCLQMSQVAQHLLD